MSLIQFNVVLFNVCCIESLLFLTLPGYASLGGILAPEYLLGKVDSQHALKSKLLLLGVLHQVSDVVQCQIEVADCDLGSRVSLLNVT